MAAKAAKNGKVPRVPVIPPEKILSPDRPYPANLLPCPGPGRKSSDTPEIASVICRGIAQGMSVEAVCASSDDLPCFDTVYEWMRTNPAFSEMVARAREDKAELLFDRFTAASEKCRDRDDWWTWTQERGVDPKALNALVNATDKGLGRTLDALKRLNPAKYGDKSQLEVTGSIDIVAQMSEARVRRLQAMAEVKAISQGKAVPEPEE